MLNGKKIALGIEFGSTRIKSVLIDMNHNILASGSYRWENEFENDLWFYKLEDAVKGMQESYADLNREVRKKYGSYLTSIESVGISGMMHGYIALDSNGKQLFPFLTWRNTNTGEAAEYLSNLFNFNIPLRWSVSHLYQQILNNSDHVKKIVHIFTLSAYIHFILTGKNVIGIDDASGMFPFDCETMGYDRKCLDKFNEIIREKKYLWQKLEDILPVPLAAGEDAGTLTCEGAAILDVSGNLESGSRMVPPEGDASTGMVCTNAVKPGTGNLSAGTSTFMMFVLDKNLSRPYQEIDIVNTPSGKPVAMIHLGNGSSEIDAWVKMFMELFRRTGKSIDVEQMYEILFNAAMEGDPDAGNIMIFNYLAGEAIMGCSEGRPLIVRKPESKLTLSNFMRSNIYAIFASIASKNKIFDDEHVVRKTLKAHGGLFKTTDAVQRFLSAALNIPVTVNTNAGEGGPYGMAILAAFAVNREEHETLEDYLQSKVFGSVDSKTIMASPADVKGFEKYLKSYERTLEVEKAAIKAF